MCRFCGAEEPLPNAVISEIHSLQRRVHHLEIDNQSLSLHNGSYKEDLARAREQHRVQMAQSVQFANKQTELKLQQQLQLASYLGTDKLIQNLQTENASMLRELKGLKHKVDALQTTEQSLRDELNYSRSVIALYSYPKTSALHQMAAYKRPGTTPNRNRLNGRYSGRIGSGGRGVQELHSKVSGVGAFDIDFQTKVNTTSIATYTMNPNTSTAHKHTRKRQRSQSNVV